MRNILIASLLIGGVLTAPDQGLAQGASQVPSKPGYVLVVGKTTDRSKIGGYAAALPPIYASNSGYYLAIGGAGRGVTWLEGPWRDRSLIFAVFPSRPQVDAFWWGDAYRQAIRKRDNAGVFSVVALEGLAPLTFQGAGTGFLIVMTAPKNDSRPQTDLSSQAAATLQRGVLASGGLMLTASERGQFTPLEGDSVFDRVTIAAWPTVGGRDAYLASGTARQAAQLRARLGLSVVASANGVPATQAPPAATPQPPPN